MHLVEEEYAPCAWKFTINPDTFLNFVVEGKAMRPESLSHNFLASKYSHFFKKTPRPNATHVYENTL